MKSCCNRILLKLSGESLQGDRVSGLDVESCNAIADSIIQIIDSGAEVGVVIGGGNHFRGKLSGQFGFERTTADQIGMLSTIINALALAEVLKAKGAKAQVLTAFQCGAIAETFSVEKANAYLSRGVISIFAGGTGNPYFTTDTAAAVRACEIKASLVIKATKVDGVYTKDPSIKGAQLLQNISYTEALSSSIEIMDAAAMALLRDNCIPLHVVNMFTKDALVNVVKNKPGGTRVSITGE